MTAKKHLVVGGAGGVGSALIELLVKRGHEVVTTVLNAKEASTIEQRFEGKVQHHLVDLSDADAALVKFKTIVSALDSLDAVTICAAIAPNGPAEFTALSTFRRSYEINCVANMAVYQAAMPALRQSKGRIVVLGSMAGRVAFTFMSAYVASKFALEGLCDVMRREAEPQGVKISLVEPGGIRTNLVYQQLSDIRHAIATIGEEEKRLYGQLYEGYLRVSEASMDGNSSTAEQVAEIVLEALETEHPQTRYIAGQDAKDFLSAFGTMPDREIDAVFNRMYYGEPELLVR
ncbi:SDR family NAD(P)-dependent oxidoreductase [Sphingobium sp. EM0848]|uniref:SDR family NAD(P)-dependent oxidoreductase n=1 Tax=Sphingobium sp. EM0848 TaxID=2743473 RepID=UPI00159C3990|nr:SDR family NAD(P)-dependent oxidoreductase [Sphingobium sp. EM0848]